MMAMQKAAVAQRIGIGFILQFPEELKDLQERVLKKDLAFFLPFKTTISHCLRKW